MTQEEVNLMYLAKEVAKEITYDKYTLGSVTDIYSTFKTMIEDGVEIDMKPSFEEFCVEDSTDYLGDIVGENDYYTLTFKPTKFNADNKLVYDFLGEFRDATDIVHVKSRKHNLNNYLHEIRINHQLLSVQYWP